MGFGFEFLDTGFGRYAGFGLRVVLRIQVAPYRTHTYRGLEPGLTYGGLLYPTQPPKHTPGWKEPCKSRSWKLGHHLHLLAAHHEARQPEQCSTCFTGFQKVILILVFLHQSKDVQQPTLPTELVARS